MQYTFTKYDGLSEYAIFKKKDDTECKVHKTEIADAFCTYGGSFVKFLGDALYHADHINSSKLINTRAGYVEDYANTFIFPTKIQDEKKQKEPRNPSKGTEKN